MQNESQAQKNFNLSRTHQAGHFLRVFPDALKVLQQHRKEARGMFNIESRRHGTFA